MRRNVTTGRGSPAPVLLTIRETRPGSYDPRNTRGPPSPLAGATPSLARVSTPRRTSGVGLEGRATAPGEGPDAGDRDRSARVLMIEDDPTVAEIVVRYLERDGFTATWESDGAAGLALALHDEPDLVVLDLMLPGMDGYEICRRLRETLPVPIIMLTAREFDLLAHLCTHPGHAFAREELLEAVWGYSYGDASTVTVHVRRLREKVEEDPSKPALIRTVWGVGYRWDG